MIIETENSNVVEIRNLEISMLDVTGNIRKMQDDDKIKELMNSIESIGLLNPITVRYDEGKKQFKVLAGHRRAEACKRLYMKRIPCRILDKHIDNDLRVMIDENEQREDITVLEEADFIAKKLRELDINQKTFAEMVGKSESWVADRVAVNKYPTELLTALKRKKITFSVAREFAKIDNHQVMKRYLDYAVTSGCTPRMAREWVKQYNQDKDYKPVNELFEDEDVEDGYQELEVNTGCHICHGTFPLRAAVHINVCPTCANKIWSGGRP